MNTPTEDKELLLLRVSLVAQRLSISRSRAYELVAAGVIPSVRLGASVRVPTLALKRFVEKLEEEMSGT